MRLPEEKKLVLLYILAAIIIALTIAIQLSDSGINDHYRDLFRRQGKINNILLHKLTNQLKINEIEVLQSIKTDFYIINCSSDNPDYTEICKKFERGEISKAEFLTQSKQIYQKIYDSKSEEYDSERSDLEELAESGTPWYFWKIIFIILQSVVIVLLLLGYVHLYIEIKNKVYKRSPQTQKNKTTPI